MSLGLIIILTVVFPIAWLWAELGGGATLRRVLGMVAILWSFGIAAMVGSLRDFSANVYFTTASKKLLEASVEQLRAGRQEAVLREWARANEEFHPTYENRARYRQVVDQAIEGMKK